LVDKISPIAEPEGVETKEAESVLALMGDVEGALPGDAVGACAHNCILNSAIDRVSSVFFIIYNYYVKLLDYFINNKLNNLLIMQIAKRLVKFVKPKFSIKVNQINGCNQIPHYSKIFLIIW
jgi:hypothetical protein